MERNVRRIYIAARARRYLPISHHRYDYGQAAAALPGRDLLELFGQ